MDKTVSISTSELKAKLSSIIKQLRQRRGAVFITKRGRPVAKLVPLDDQESGSLSGFARGCITVNSDLLEPLDVEWEALK